MCNRRIMRRVATDCDLFVENSMRSRPRAAKSISIRKKNIDIHKIVLYNVIQCEVTMAESDLIRGNVDTVILKVLFEGDRYGYDLIKQINARSGGQWEIRQATLYASLKRLEKQEFISSYWDSSESESGGGRRKYYSLTERGREVFVTYKNEWERSRDLFGELIVGSKPILPTDDFSDVEDETYDLPKRRAKRKPKKADKQAKAEAPAPAETVYESTTSPADAAAAPQYEQPQPAPVAEPTQAQPAADETEQTSQADDNMTGFASLFDLLYTPEEETARNADATQAQAETSEPQAPTERQAQPAADEATQTVYASDPHEILERMYAQEQNGESYADARGRFYNEYSADAIRQSEKPTAKAAAPVPPAPVEPAHSAPTVPAPAETNAIAPVDNRNELAPVALPEDESAARLAYKEIFADLVNRFDGAQAATAEQEQVAADGYEDEYEEEEIRIRRFSGVEQAAAELGNAVDIREHNNSAKQYAHEYYYYSNKLMMTQYTITCAAMFVVGLSLFLTFYMGLGMRMRYDFALYIAAGLFPIVMFIAAVLKFAGNPDKKKRINLNFRVSVFVRFIIMLQVAVVVYCLNLIWGMPVAFSVKHVPSLVIPIAYALFIPINKLIFISLLKSGRYALD